MTIKKFAEYLESTGMTKTALARAEEVISFYVDNCPEKIERVFITDYVTEEGSREFESLWLFSPSLLMEASNFLSQDDFDFASVDTGITRLVTRKENYDFRQADGKSRLNVEFSLGTQISGQLKASGRNCDYLRDVLKQILLPKLTNLGQSSGRSGKK